MDEQARRRADGDVVEYTPGRGISWREVLRRARGVFTTRPHQRGWSLLVPLIAAFAGLLLTTTARTAAGTTLREDRRPQIAKLIEERRQQIEDDNKISAGLRADIDASTEAQAGSDSRIAEQQARANAIKLAAGLTKVHGPGVVVRLDDAPRRADGSLPAGARPDDVVVHQQDVQSVVNALWAGGAEAMMIMDVRVISTSAVRCVGNTLLLHGRVYSPPFTVSAIGDPAALRRALDAAQGVRAFSDAARAWGLGYGVDDVGDIAMPAFDGPTTLDHAEVDG
jgi:uncharacterized protein YlxW (UPF0749 family)